MASCAELALSGLNPAGGSGRVVASGIGVGATFAGHVALGSTAPTFDAAVACDRDCIAKNADKNKAITMAMRRDLIRCRCDKVLTPFPLIDDEASLKLSR